MANQDQFWMMFAEGSTSGYRLSTEVLSDWVTDVPSWLAFMKMVITGMPADMKIIRNDGDVTNIRVIAVKDANQDGGSYDDPYGTNIKPKLLSAPRLR